jgi:hypothetical protein
MQALNHPTQYEKSGKKITPFQQDSELQKEIDRLDSPEAQAIFKSVSQRIV